MWQTSKATSSRPSLLLCIDDPLAAYLFDAAVVAFGTIVENALQETVEQGSGSNRRHVPRYRITDILQDGFTFPRENPLAVFKGFDNYEEVTA